MPAIFLAVAALVLNVLMIRLIEQQRTVIGTLKAIGYSDAQIFLHFTKYGIALGTLGGVIGLLLGNRMALFVTNLYKQFFEFPELTSDVYPGTYLAGLAISFCCALVGSIQGARGALRLNPAEAMRQKPPVQGGAIWLEHFARLWRRLSFGWRLVLRNVFRNKLRTTVGVFAAAMGAGLLVCGFILRTAVIYLISFQFDLVNRSDLDLTFDDELGAAALLEAQRLIGVEHAEPVLDVSCTFVNGHHRRNGGVTGLTRGARLTIPRDRQGRPIRIPPNGLAMSRKLSQLLHLSRGDYVTMIPTKGRRDELRVPVAEISDAYVGLSVYADIHYLSRLIGEEFAMTGVQLMLDRRPAERDALHRELKAMPAIRSINARADVIKNLMDTIVNTQKIFIGLIVIFAGVIFFSSLLNASLISLAERRREVATLRVLGYTPWQVGGLFLRESMVINVLGTLLGLPLGYSLAKLMSVIYDTEMFRFPLISPPPVWINTVVLAIVFAIGAHLIVQWNVHKLDWLEASKTKE
jgi:putative ABC transport system permease protein